MKRFLPFAVPLLALAACSSNAPELTEVVLAVDSDLVVPHQVDEIELVVTGPTGQTQSAKAPVAGAGAIKMPLTLSLSPGADALGFSVKATARFQGEEVISNEVRTSFVRGQRRLLTIPLVTACLAITCGAGQTCGTGGKCAPIDVAPDALPSWAGKTPDAMPVYTGGGGIDGLGAGEAHTCALTTSKRVLCWGNNDEGELGTDARQQRVAPRLVRDLENVVEVTGSVDYTCARTGAGEVFCWGLNEDGQLGNGQSGTGVTSAKPVKVQGLANATQIATGEGHACALDNAGAVWCWGHNHHGQLGDGTTTDRPAPVRVTLAGPAARVSVGEDHTCALLASGSVQCWGANEFGALGDGVTDGLDNPTPQTVKNIADAKQIRCGAYHTCVVRAQRVVSCWGRNNRGQLGDNKASGDISVVPVQVSVISDTKAVVAGEFHSCAQSESGIVSCWGGNEFGQLGDGTTADRAQPVPVQFQSGSAQDELSGGMFHNCARKTLGAVQCWGSNEKGQLGDGATENRLKPVTTIGLP